MADLLPNTIQFYCGCTWDSARSPEMAYLSDETEAYRAMLTIQRDVKDTKDTKEAELAQEMLDKFIELSEEKEKSKEEPKLEVALDVSVTIDELVADPKLVYDTVVFETIPDPPLACPRHKESRLLSAWFDPAWKEIP